MTSIRQPIQNAFSETSDPAAYVPRAATESVLEEIVNWSKSSDVGSSVAALISPPGFGKTLLLRVFEMRLAAERAAGRGPPRSLYLPYAGLSATDLCLWVHGLLGIAPDAAVADGAPEAALAALMALAPGRGDPFFLLIDDADSMPPPTVRLLIQSLPREGSPLRIVMAIGDDARASRLLAALDSLAPAEVRLRKAMSQDETESYLRARMKRAGILDSEIARIDASAVARMFTLSGGVPRRLHRVVESIFDSDSNRLPSELDEKQKREDWMGRPLEDDL
jgi:type II secretory pathway predicted ATPase ExeA